MAIGKALYAEKSDSRTVNTSRNLMVSVFMQVIKLLLKFVCRTVLITYLGIEYAGLDSVFTNVLAILSLSELGIGTAIIYKMYQPIAENDYEKIKSYVHFYKKVYSIIGATVFVLGISLIPVLDVFVDLPTGTNVNLYVIYLLFVLNSSLGYFIAYKRSLLTGYQQNYIENVIKTIFLVSLNISQILVVVIFKNYYLYVALMIAFTIAENIYVTIVVNKKYPFVKEPYMPLSSYEKKALVDDTFYLFVNKITGTIITGTDTILVSTFFGLIMSAKYSNYLIIIEGISTFIGFFLVSFTASVGNLIATTTKAEVFKVYKRLRFLFNIVNGFACICLIVLLPRFIDLWVGYENRIEFSVMLVCVINSYCLNSRNFIRSFKQTAGLFKNAWYFYIIEAILNIALSIVLLKTFGLIGVALGTILSSLLSTFISEPIVVYKNCFEEKVRDYYLNYVLTLLIVGIICLIVINIVNAIPLVGILGFVIDLLVCVVITIILFVIVFSRFNDFKYYVNVLKRLLRSKE